MPSITITVTVAQAAKAVELLTWEKAQGMDPTTTMEDYAKSLVYQRWLQMQNILRQEASQQDIIDGQVGDQTDWDT